MELPIPSEKVLLKHKDNMIFIETGGHRLHIAKARSRSYFEGHVHHRYHHYLIQYTDKQYKGQLSAVPILSTTVLPNFPCLYRRFLCV